MDFKNLSDIIYDFVIIKTSKVHTIKKKSDKILDIQNDFLKVGGIPNRQEIHITTPIVPESNKSVTMIYRYEVKQVVLSLIVYIL